MHRPLGILLEMTHKQAYEMGKGVAKSSRFKQLKKTDTEDTPSSGGTLKTSISFLEETIHISVAMDLNRILA